MPMPRFDGSAQVTFSPLMKICPAETSEQSGDAIQQRGLAATRRAKQHQKLALPDLKVQVAQHLYRAKVEVEIPDRDAGVMHCVVQPFTAPAAMPRTKSLPEMK